MGLFSAILGNASTVPNEELTREYGGFLTQGETIDVGFKLIRDTFIFTSKRLIVVDKQGFTGSKIEYKSVPYTKISKFSIETAGTFDLDAELHIWLTGDGLPSISKKFNKSVNIYDVYKLLSEYTL